jgi:hypothetical protein
MVLRGYINTYRSDVIRADALYGYGCKITGQAVYCPVISLHVDYAGPLVVKLYKSPEQFEELAVIIPKLTSGIHEEIYLQIDSDNFPR